MCCIYQGDWREKILGTMYDIDANQRQRYRTKIGVREREKPAVLKKNSAEVTIVQKITVRRRRALALKARPSHQREQHIRRQGIGPEHFPASIQSASDCLRKLRYHCLHCRTVRRSTISRKRPIALGLWLIRRVRECAQTGSTVQSVASRRTMRQAIRCSPPTWEPFGAR
jgi:hypothetical protein